MANDGRSDEAHAVHDQEPRSICSYYHPVVDIRACLGTLWCEPAGQASPSRLLPCPDGRGLGDRLDAGPARDLSTYALEARAVRCRGDGSPSLGAGRMRIAMFGGPEFMTRVMIPMPALLLSDEMTMPALCVLVQFTSVGRKRLVAVDKVLLHDSTRSHLA